jgi:hypothetical protein
LVTRSFPSQPDLLDNGVVGLDDDAPFTGTSTTSSEVEDGSVIVALTSFSVLEAAQLKSRPVSVLCWDYFVVVQSDFVVVGSMEIRESMYSTGNRTSPTQRRLMHVEV